MTLTVNRRQEKFTADCTRVITKPYFPTSATRISTIINRVLSLPEETITIELFGLLENFAYRHRNILEIFGRNFNTIKQFVYKVEMTDQRRALIGAYFTHEYSIQAAAFFNPSLIPHFDQSGLKPGQLRVIISFRSTGEGHISSLEFRTAVIDSNGVITMDPVSRYAETGKLVENSSYEKDIFLMKLAEVGIKNTYVDDIFDLLQKKFRTAELNEAIKTIDLCPGKYTEVTHSIATIQWLVESNYELEFQLTQKLNERVIFPISSNERNGIEDARFVKFMDDGKVTYYATYTAYNGTNIAPQLLKTDDFLYFKISTLNGKASINKGMALFPRKINGKYMMISRNDGESLYIMASDNIHSWNHTTPLRGPVYPWEFMQIGNCGSPLETPWGWILMTHGVGPMRQYAIGALLLDLNDPSIIIGASETPILTPNAEEREGYVPNVVYSCGSLIHDDTLLIAYAMSDTRSGFATVSVKELVDWLKKS
jgi:predicted GH43/DUF377 family glycosyl hydrolase